MSSYYVIQLLSEHDLGLWFSAILRLNRAGNKQVLLLAEIRKTNA